MSGGTFNIASQQAGAIFQAAGDQTIHHGEGTMTVDVLGAVSDLRGAVEASDLRRGDRRDALRALDEVEAELRRPSPEKERVAGKLHRTAALLKEAGGLAGAANALQQLARWLGPVGVGLLGVLV